MRLGGGSQLWGSDVEMVRAGLSSSAAYVLSRFRQPLKSEWRLEGADVQGGQLSEGSEWRHRCQCI